MEYFDLQLEEWVDFDTLNFARRKLGTAVPDGQALYVMGGDVTTDFVLEVEKYELPNHAVTQLEIFDVFTIQPNPINDFFHLQVEGQPLDYLVFDLIGITGQKLLTETLNFQSGKIDKTYSCKDFPKGMYFVRVKSIQGRESRKILIQ